MSQFNIRVYGILIDDEKRVLISDELIRGQYITKFPGGGLEYGEGTRDCLKREFIEELNLKIEVGDHLYTTDFFQKSAFHPDHQIISIYYMVTPIETIAVRLSDKEFDFDETQLAAYKEKNETETFRLIPWKNFNEACVTLPIDKFVVKMLNEKF